ncbi:MAG: GGDEF domain-containing protein [Thermoanaerobaculia bacterium]
MDPAVRLAFAGLVAQTAGAVLLVGLDLLLFSYSRRQTFFKLWAWAWAALALALAALCWRYLRFPVGLGESAARLAPGVAPLYGLYAGGKVAFLGLLLLGLLRFARGTPVRDGALVVGGAALIAGSVAGAGGWPLERLAWAQSPLVVLVAGAGATLLFTLPRDRRTRSTALLAGALVLLALLWTVYGVAFSEIIDGDGALAPLLAFALSHNSLLDLLVQGVLGFGMVLLLLEEQRQEWHAARSQLEIAYDELLRLALTDPLTGCLNRAAFEEGAGLQALAGDFGAVVIFDLDHLKFVNDTFGHAAGDDLLRGFATEVRRRIRPGDGFYRWGGDEFLLLLRRARGAEARARVDAVLADLPRVQIPSHGRLLPLAASFGCAEYGSREDLAVAIALADAEMYGDKSRRRGTAGRPVTRRPTNGYADLQASLLAAAATPVPPLARVEGRLAAGAEQPAR